MTNMISQFLCSIPVKREMHWIVNNDEYFPYVIYSLPFELHCIISLQFWLGACITFVRNTFLVYIFLTFFKIPIIDRFGSWNACWFCCIRPIPHPCCLCCSSKSWRVEKDIWYWSLDSGALLVILGLYLVVHNIGGISK